MLRQSQHDQFLDKQEVLALDLKVKMNVKVNCACKHNDSKFGVK